MSRSPSRNQLSPPSSAAVSSAFQRLVRAAPARASSSTPGERVEDRVEIGRDVEAEHLEVVADVADDRHVARVDVSVSARAKPRAADAARRARRPSRGEPGAERVSAAAVRGAEPAVEPLEVGERVDVVGQVRDRRGRRRNAEPLGARAEPLGAARPVERREQAAATASASALVVPSAAATSASPPSGSAPSSASRSRGCAHGRSALTTRTGPDSTPRSAASTAAPWPPVARGDDELADRPRRPRRRRRASPARAQCARRGGSGSSRRLPSSPRKGTTTVDMRLGAVSVSWPGPRVAHSRSSYQCVSRSASATCGSVCAG